MIERSHKKTGAFAPVQCWLVRPEKPFLRGAGAPSPAILPPHVSRLSRELGISSYAVRLGRVVRSRTCVRMLDICIPFSEETNGIISAMNGSFINSLISS